MADYQTDDEQVEHFKDWWARNGLAILIGVIIGVVALGAWRGWEAWQRHLGENASMHYTKLQEAMARNDTNTVIQEADLLREEFSGTPYGVLGALAAAKQYAEQGELERSAQALRWVMEQTEQETVAAIARIRLARVEVARNNPDAALELLNAGLPPAYAGLVEEGRGDALVAKGELAGARAAYDRALESAGGGNAGDNEFLRMKRDALGAGEDAKPS